MFHEIAQEPWASGGFFPGGSPIADFSSSWPKTFFQKGRIVVKFEFTNSETFFY